MNLYELAGGGEALRQMAETFLAKAQADPLLGEMFAGKDEHAEHIAGFFIASFDGPADYLHERGGLRELLKRHVGLNITEAQRARWLELMTESARETGMPETFVAIFTDFLQGPSRNTARISNLDPARAEAMLGR